MYEENKKELRDQLTKAAKARLEEISEEHNNISIVYRNMQKEMQEKKNEMDNAYAKARKKLMSDYDTLFRKLEKEYSIIDRELDQERIRLDESLEHYQNYPYWDIQYHIEQSKVLQPNDKLLMEDWSRGLISNEDFIKEFVKRNGIKKRTFEDWELISWVESLGYKRVTI